MYAKRGKEILPKTHRNGTRIDSDVSDYVTWMFDLINHTAIKEELQDTKIKSVCTSISLCTFESCGHCCMTLYCLHASLSLSFLPTHGAINIYQKRRAQSEGKWMKCQRNSCFTIPYLLRMEMLWLCLLSPSSQTTK